jgi:CheY-like chemotaxis protein
MAYRILVVEDEPDKQDNSRPKLDGHRVETTDNGQEALNLLAGRSYDRLARKLNTVDRQSRSLPSRTRWSAFER